MRAWKLLLVALFVLLASCNLVKPTSAPPSRATATPLPPGHTAVSPDKAVDIPVRGGASLSVPQGAFSQETVLRVERSVAPGLPQETSTVRLVSDVYEVELKAWADVRKPLTLTIPYKPDQIPEGGSPQALTVVWWDGGAWREIPSKVDTVARVVSAQIDHFSRFSAAWSWFKDLAYDVTGAIRSAFFDASLTREAFTIHYTTKPRWLRVLTDHRPPQEDANRNGHPDYVERLAEYFVTSRQSLERIYGLTIPVSGSIHVFVLDLDGVNGDADPRTSHIGIHNKLNDNELRTTAAHELFHYWQFSRLWLLTGDKHRWWMEGTTTPVVDAVFPTGGYAEGKMKGGSPPEPPLTGFYEIGSKDTTTFYATGTLARYLESRYPGFTMRTFDPQGGLNLLEWWVTTFARILQGPPYRANFAEVFDDYLVSYYYHGDLAPGTPHWSNAPNLSKLLFAGDGFYQRVQERMLPLSGRMVVMMMKEDLKPATLVVRQHGADLLPEVKVFANRLVDSRRERVALPGQSERRGVVFPRARLGTADPRNRRVVIEGFGKVKLGARASEVYILTTNVPRDTADDPYEILVERLVGRMKPSPAYRFLDLEIYMLQPPEDLRAENIGTDRVKISWTASSLPRGEKDDDKGALKGYALYRQVPGGQPALLERVDAKSPPSLELSVQKATGGQQQASLFMRTVDKYDTESSDSEPVLVRSAGPPQPPTKKLTGRIYLGATPSGQLDKMNHGLYVITPDDRRWRLISPRAIDGVAISPDGSKLAVGMLAETGAGPGDPQLAIFDAKDPAYKLLRSVFTTRPGTSSRAEQLTGPSWAGDSTTLALERVGDIHLYQYAQDKSQDKVTFWAMWEGYSPAWSPTDDRLVLQGKSGDGLYLLDNARLGAYKFDPKYEIWAKEASQGFRELRQGAVKKIEGSPSGARAPRWSRDGKNIVFASKGVVSVIPAAGGSVKALTPADWKAGVPVYSPDGAYIAFARLEAEPNGGVWAMKADGTEPRQVLKTDLSHVWNIDLAWGP